MSGDNPELSFRFQLFSIQIITLTCYNSVFQIGTTMARHTLQERRIAIGIIHMVKYLLQRRSNRIVFVIYRRIVHIFFPQHNEASDFLARFHFNVVLIDILPHIKVKYM